MLLFASNALAVPSNPDMYTGRDPLTRSKDIHRRNWPSEGRSMRVFDGSSAITTASALRVQPFSLIASGKSQPGDAMCTRILDVTLHICSSLRGFFSSFSDNKN